MSFDVEETTTYKLTPNQLAQAAYLYVVTKKKLDLDLSNLDTTAPNVAFECDSKRLVSATLTIKAE